jgi:eukaryotic-like serine/threonine-protein kinase
VTSRRNPEVADLERQDRIEEAAELAVRRGEHRDAAELWERACRFERAAAAWLASGDAEHALLLAARAGARGVEAKAIAELAENREPALRVAERVARAGSFASAARLREALGDHRDAARDFERAGELAEAARAYERGGETASAARCWQEAIAGAPDDQTARLALGKLLCEHRRDDAALGVLQGIPEAAAERAAALPLLRAGLLRLELGEAAREIEREMAARGVAASDAEVARTPPSAPAESELLFGRYQTKRLVATTPTARVYEAVDRLTRERVAVKLFAAAELSDSGRDALRNFEREACVLGELHHPAIVPLRAYFPEGPAVVLAWMAGGSLADLLAGPPLAPARAAEITGALLGALSEAHRRGILHRDVKPANVLFDEAGAAHLSDFGTAHMSDRAATVTAGVIGTLAYMAPEQRHGAPACIASDVYSAGALLWHALTGAPPDAGLPFLSSELDAEARAAANALIAPVDERPADALTARERVRQASWPSSVPAARIAPRVAEARRRAPSDRLEPLGGARCRDSLLDREIYVLAADPATLERVLPMARADHPALAAVLVHRAGEHSVWIDAAPGAALEDELDDDEHAELAEALSALHRAGGVHGRVDREHVVRRGGRVVLRYALEPLTSTPEDDRCALDALKRPPA